ncbi:hypothetical protein QAD02_011275 [Eretmocerus hayati]|uniref:Uncharacterized protein n=1 Tax=Eretmocerus hayati TaxID=131215 RepID=A0ACC2NW43_9HYME|nr:hypothetical protein QAD02_011275 [Eretmocerus hayati]
MRLFVLWSAVSCLLLLWGIKESSTSPVALAIKVLPALATIIPGCIKFFETHKKIIGVKTDNDARLPRLLENVEDILKKESDYHSERRQLLTKGLNEAERYIRTASTSVADFLSQVDGAAETIQRSRGSDNDFTYQWRKIILSRTVADVATKIEESIKLTESAIKTLDEHVINHIEYMIYIIRIASKSSSTRMIDLINAQSNVIRKNTPKFDLYFFSIGGDKEAMQAAQKLKEKHHSDLTDMLIATEALRDFLLSMRDKCQEIKSECEDELRLMGIARGRNSNAYVSLKASLELEEMFKGNEKMLVDASNELVAAMKQLNRELHEAYGIPLSSRRRRSINPSNVTVAHAAIRKLSKVKSQGSCCSIYLVDNSGVLSYECGNPHEDTLCVPKNITQLIKGFEDELNGLLASLKLSHQSCSNSFDQVFDCYQFVSCVDLDVQCESLPELVQTTTVAYGITNSYGRHVGKYFSSTIRTAQNKSIVKHIAPETVTKLAKLTGNFATFTGSWRRKLVQIEAEKNEFVAFIDSLFVTLNRKQSEESVTDMVAKKVQESRNTIDKVHLSELEEKIRQVNMMNVATAENLGITPLELSCSLDKGVITQFQDRRAGRSLE